MRGRIGALAAVIGLVAAVGVAGSAVAAKTSKFTQTAVGAQISQKGTSFEGVYKLTSSVDGSGAAVQVGKTKGLTFPLTGSSTITSYYADGVTKSKTTFTIGKPNAKGISAVTGSGKCVAGGTGVHKHETCSYTTKGTYDTKTTITKIKVTGTGTR